MIQVPRSGEILIDIPDAGTLLAQHDHLQRCFGRALVRGAEEHRDGMRCVRWAVGEATPLPSNDPRYAAEADRIASYVDRARRAADAMTRLLAQNRASVQVELGVELLALMGLPGSTTRMSRRDVERLSQVHRLAAEAVEHAVKNGGLVQFPDGRIGVVNWAFLPRKGGGKATDPPLLVGLSMAGRGGAVSTFEWSTEGPATDVELHCRRPGAEPEVVGFAKVSDDLARGSWDVPSDRVPPGSALWATAHGPAGAVSSNEIRIPMPEAPIGAAPSPTVAPVPAVPAASRGPRDRRWLRPLLVTLAILALLFLLWLLWLLFPGRAHVARSSPLLIKPGLAEPPPERTGGGFEVRSGEAGGITVVPFDPSATRPTAVPAPTAVPDAGNGAVDGRRPAPPSKRVLPYVEEIKPGVERRKP